MPCEAALLKLATQDYVECMIDALCAMGPSKKNEKSISLDGVDEYVSVNWTGIGGSTARSISFWFKTDDVNNNSNARLVYLGVGGNFGEKYLVNKELRSGGLTFSVVGSGGTGIAMYRTNLADDQWHHVLWTYPSGGDTHDWRVFVDGIEVTSEMDFTAAATPNTLTSNNVKIGTGDSNDYFKDEIDEVVIWNVDVSAASCEVYALGRFQPDYKKDFGRYVFSSDVQLWLRCGDGDTHPTLTDASGNSRNGTMTNTESGDIVSDSAH